MKYRNTVTGAEIVTDCRIVAGPWETVAPPVVESKKVAPVQPRRKGRSGGELRND